MALASAQTRTQPDLRQRVRTLFSPLKARVKRRGRGVLSHDYLVPGGVYEEQWDWDAFFIGMALASEIPTEAAYLRNWALNYLENSREDGFTPGLLTPEGPDWRINHMKPVLAQGCAHASRLLRDSDWLRKAGYYERLKTIVLYRERHVLFHPALGLGAWTDSMESGADNNVALLDFPKGSVAASDLNSFLFCEYAAMSDIAEMLGMNEDRDFFRDKAENLRRAVVEKLWCGEDGTFYNIDARDESFIRVAGYSSIHPFWAGIATREQAEAFFRRYVLEPAELLSPFGIRSLTRSHPRYNNVNMIKPHSNWQGPVWPIVNVFFIHALLRYGYQEEARDVAERVIGICVRDIERTGAMHENYDAETGEPLAAPNFVGWNLLLMNVLDEIEERRNPFAINFPNR